MRKDGKARRAKDLVHFLHFVRDGRDPRAFRLLRDHRIGAAGHQNIHRVVGRRDVQRAIRAIHQPWLETPQIITTNVATDLGVMLNRGTNGIRKQVQDLIDV